MGTEPPRTKILVVDDDPIQRDLVREIFRRDPYEVLEAENAAAGLETALERMPQLILVDMRMPGMSGLDFVRSARAHPEIRHIPVVVSTALASSLQGFECIQSGAADYFTKPLHPDDFRAKVKKLLGHPA